MSEPSADPPVTGRDERRKRLRRLFRLAVIPLALLGVLTLELGLRLKGHLASWSELNGGSYVSPYTYKTQTPWLLLSGAPNQTKRFNQPEFDYEIQLNDLGVRDVVHPKAKPAGEYRVAVIGDSFTMGQGAEFAGCYPQVLGQLLNEPPRRQRVRILQAGVSGSDPVFGLQLLRRRLVDYGLDLVIFAVNESDVFDLLTRGGLDRFDAEGRVIPLPAPGIEWFYARSYLFRAVIRSRIFRYDWDLRSPAEHAAAVEAAQEQLAQVAAQAQALGRERGFQVVFVSHPFDYQLRDHAAKDLVAPLAGPLKEQGVPFFDLVAAMRKRVDPEKVDEIYWPRDKHHNAKGYALMAELIAARLGELPGFPPGR